MTAWFKFAKLQMNKQEHFIDWDKSGADWLECTVRHLEKTKCFNQIFIRSIHDVFNFCKEKPTLKCFKPRK